MIHSNEPLRKALALEEALMSGMENPPAESGSCRRYLKKMGKSIQDRFMSYVKKGADPESCWEWIGGKEKFGYGKFSIRDKCFPAHRVGYTLFMGDIPDGLVLDHQCNNPSCVRPSHLTPMTQRANVLRGNTFQARNASKTHCVNGHAFTDASTYRRKDGARQCRPCVKAAKMRLRTRKREIEGEWKETR